MKKEILKKNIYNIVRDESVADTILMDYFLCSRFDIPSDISDSDCAVILAKAQECTTRPVQYVFQIAPFYDMELFVNEDVLIPRFDTELLAERVIKECDDMDIVLDLCTGSGAIALAVAKHTKAVVFGSDISAKALEVAKENLRRQNEKNVACRKPKISVKFVESDLFENITIKFSKIVCNPPYISKQEMAELDRFVIQEPMSALYGGEDGLDFYRKISMVARAYLFRGGKIYFEVGYRQGEIVKNMLEFFGYSDIEIEKDYSGNDRVVSATYGVKI